MYKNGTILLIVINMPGIILPRGHQKDGSIIDMYGNKLSREERLQIMEQVA